MNDKLKKEINLNGKDEEVYTRFIMVNDDDDIIKKINCIASNLLELDNFY
jgi:hypothetical protein